MCSFLKGFAWRDEDRRPRPAPRSWINGGTAPFEFTCWVTHNEETPQMSCGAATEVLSGVGFTRREGNRV